MRHWKARTLLPALLDRTLPAAEEAGVRQHAAGCRRCSQVLLELEECDRLLARLPGSLFSPEAPEAGGRIRALARWAADPEPSLAERLGATAVGTAAAAAMLLVLVSVGSWEVPPRPPQAVSLAAVVPDTALLPMGRIR